MRSFMLIVVLLLGCASSSPCPALVNRASAASTLKLAVLVTSFDVVLASKDDFEFSCGSLDSACHKVNTSITVGGDDTGMFCAVDNGTITATNGFKGKLATYKCNHNDSPKVIIQDGAYPQSVTVNGGEATAEAGSKVGILSTNGGKITGTTGALTTAKANGGDITINAGSSAVDTASTNGGTISITATSVQLAKSNGGTININKAAVDKASTNGGNINLCGGATAKTKISIGGSISNGGCPSHISEVKGLNADGALNTESSTSELAIAGGVFAGLLAVVVVVVVARRNTAVEVLKMTPALAQL